MTPRDDQLELIAAARAKIKEIQARLDAQGIKRKPRLMIQAGCGFGKTFLSAWMTKSALEKGGTTAFLSHRGFLQDQTSMTFKKLGIPHSFLASGKSLNPNAKSHLGMVGSMRTRQSKIKPPNICFFDESHHTVAKSWKAILEAWPNTTFIGLSATPGARSDKVGLNEVYDDIVCGPPVSELIRSNALSDFRYFQGRPPAELVQLRLSAADSTEKQADIMDKPVIIGDIVGTYRKKAMGKKAIYFTPTRKMGQDLAAAFNAAGIPFSYMDADTPDWERKRIARDIASGKTMGFTNVNIAGEGYDLAAQAGKDVTIEVVGLCRRTQSLPLLIQMAMRSMRAKSNGGVGLILDHADNFSLHKFLPDDDIEWNLEGAIRKPKDVKAIQCPTCLATAYPGPGGTCKHCGSSLKDGKIEGVRTRAEMEIIEGELIEVTRLQQEKVANEAAEAYAKKREEWDCQTESDWIALGKRRGINNYTYWAKMKFKGRQNYKRKSA